MSIPDKDKVIVKLLRKNIAQNAAARCFIALFVG